MSGQAMQSQVSTRAVLMTTVDPLALVWFDLNDDGNAKRLVARSGGKLVFVHGWGWMAFDGRRWSSEDGTRLAALKAIEVARCMRDEIAALAEIDDQDLAARFGTWCTAELRKDRMVNLHKHSVQSGNANKTEAMLRQAEKFTELNRRQEEFDDDPLTINALNGTLRYRKVDGAWRLERSAHDPADHLTRVLDVDYDPDATCPTWEHHLEEVLPEQDVRDFFQMVAGYALSGLTSEQCIFMLQGRGGDGKSTTMNTLRELMGSYAVAADVNTFMETGTRSAADATPDLCRLAGDTRLISIQEPKVGQAIAESRVKQFTGESPVQARANYGDPFEFMPIGKVFLECNRKPRISGDDDGIWRRIVLIQFPRQFKGTAIDRTRKQKLRSEGSGILNWLLEGLRLYLEQGRLIPPQSITDAVEEYRRSANPFGEWLAARVDTSDPNVLTLASELYADYKEWCEAEGVSDRDAMNNTAFGRALGDRQINLGPRRRDGKKQRRGAKLRGSDTPIDARVDQAWPVDDDYEPL